MCSQDLLKADYMDVCHVCMYTYMPKHARLGGLGASLEIRCSEIASEAILGQKQSRSSYMARGVLHPIFGCPRMDYFAVPADLEFPRKKVLRLTKQQVG